MWIAALVKIQVAIVSDVAAHLGGVGVIRLALISPWFKRHAHNIIGEIPLLRNFFGKLVVGLADGWITRIVNR